MKTDLETLRESSPKVLRLPENAQQIVDGYLHINVGSAQAPCPYHINPGIRSIKRALLGKGNPKEIEALAANCFEKYAMHVQGDSAKLRSFLLACGIGVDCSGFAAWILNAVTEDVLGRPIWKCLKFPGLRRNLISKLRPIENISARLLTGELNAEPLPDLSQIKPGDLIRAASWHHVLVITEVGLNESGAASYFQYAQSSCMYGDEGGVRTGHAIIKKPQGSLLEQQWFDGYERSVIEELIAEGKDDSRIVRLKALTRMPE
jgi:hypothetical protein